jgi:two-component system, NarL family, invasion response regulator UvrY
MQPAEIYAGAVKQYGINYYLSKSAGEQDIIRMLQRFLQNEGPSRNSATTPKQDNPFSLLAPRELEILHYILKGMGTKEIGQTLNLRMSTISTLKNRIFEKTNAANLKELIELATLYNVNY